jgi:hypothetical protein
MRLFGLLLAMNGLAASADTLWLRDGRTFAGELVEQTREQVVFRIIADGGSAGVLRRFDTGAVLRVDRGGPAPQPLAVDRTPARVDEAQRIAERFRQMRREALELREDGDAPAALRALQRLVGEAPKPLLAELDEQTRRERGKPLPELMAELRLELADAEAQRAGGFRLKAVTPYEAAALGRLLCARQERLLATSYDNGSLGELIAADKPISEISRQARRVADDARAAAAVIGERLEHDPALGGQREQRRELERLRVQLVELAAAIGALPGYTSQDESREDKSP